MDRITITAPAKINLFLKILGRRQDGYHFLATLMQKINLYDQLELNKTPAGINLKCPDSALPEDERNLVFRAAQLFFEKSSERLPDKHSGVTITLSKKIPVAAGLGGGSSDAAASLLGLDALFETNWTVDELQRMGVTLGADVPLFLVDWPIAWAEGIGDELFPACPLLDYLVLLVNPGFSVSTQWVYENFALTLGQNIFNLINSQVGKLSHGKRDDLTHRPIMPFEIENDLERITVGRFPEINSVKNKLLQGGAVASLMSGSGPTVFGLFPKSEGKKAAVCYEELRREYRNTFLVDTLH